jgi:hypothetical protein
MDTMALGYCLYSSETPTVCLEKDTRIKLSVYMAGTQMDVLRRSARQNDCKGGVFLFQLILQKFC